MHNYIAFKCCIGHVQWTLSLLEEAGWHVICSEGTLNPFIMVLLRRSASPLYSGLSHILELVSLQNWSSAYIVDDATYSRELSPWTSYGTALSILVTYCNAEILDCKIWDFSLRGIIKAYRDATFMKVE